MVLELQIAENIQQSSYERTEDEIAYEKKLREENPSGSLVIHGQYTGIVRKKSPIGRRIGSIIPIGCSRRQLSDGERKLWEHTPSGMEVDQVDGVKSSGIVLTHG